MKYRVLVVIISPLQRYVVGNKVIIENRLLLEIEEDITTIENSL